MARKLKGKNAERLKGDNKEKMEKTRKRMDKLREEDDIRLRHKLEQKVKALEAEVAKANAIEIQLKKKQEYLRDAKLKLEGAIISLKEVLNNDSETKANS